ncbi:MAG: aldehyde ferredoxin oxidoreductase family protein [candidate division KSB1 bacterium]|nr:aldehyde ferredoxin oxidoreductase family protein [candidate division KSB1 bacterium]
MSMQNRGFANRILTVDLTTGACQTEELDERIAKLYLGGKGLGSYLLYTGMAPKVDPLGPDNLLIFATGPLSGTIAPTSSRLCVMAKSPKTGTYMDSYCGGFFGQTLKYAGYDAVVIKGAASEPRVLIIDDQKVQIADGGDLWGMNTAQATKALQERYGQDMQTAVIGPAAERMATLSGIFCGLRTAGRAGTGAVMGSKKLKGIAVRGTGSVRVANRTEYEEAVWIAHRMLRMSSQVKRMVDFGTANIVLLVNAAGALPTRNFQLGHFEQADALAGEVWRKHYWKKDIACEGCPIGCSKIAYSPKFDTAIDGPDYETIFALGSNCGVSDHEAIIYANYLCDMYGIDTITVGNIIGFVMELYERGMVGKDDLDGIEATWGSGEALVQLTEKIAKGEGVGQLLEKGVREISKHFPGSEDFAMHVKGLEIPGYLPRAAKGIGLSYAISERGACHLRGSPLVEILGGADPLTPEGKAALFKTNQTDSAVVNCLILCYFVKFGITLKEIWQMVNPCTGLEYKSPRELDHVGERIVNLARLFNLREGFTIADDTLPKRCVAEPLPAGPAKGQVVELDRLRADYYKLMGWDEKGVPKRETLRLLGIEDMLDLM